MAPKHTELLQPSGPFPAQLCQSYWQPALAVLARSPDFAPTENVLFDISYKLQEPQPNVEK